MQKRVYSILCLAWYSGSMPCDDFHVDVFLLHEFTWEQYLQIHTYSAALMSFRNQHQYNLVKSRTFMRIIWKIWSLIDVLILMRLASCAVVRMNKAVPADLWILNFNEIYILKDYNINLTAICCPVIKPLKYE